MTDITCAAVIIIGNEILSGRTQDANLSYLGTRLAQLGIVLKEARVIPDDHEIIITTVREFKCRFDYVLTTGGIGPTHDDITAAAIAAACQVELVKNAEAVACLEAYYEKGTINDARLKMANIPAGATLIYNPVSGAPGFQIGNIFVLPGVPLIMQAMFEGMTDRLTGGDPILSQSITTNLRESNIAEGLGRIQDQFPEVQIGSYPFFRAGRLGVNVVLQSTSHSMMISAADSVSGLIKQLGGRIFHDR